MLTTTDASQPAKVLRETKSTPQLKGMQGGYQSMHRSGEGFLLPPPEAPAANSEDQIRRRKLFHAMSISKGPSGNDFSVMNSKSDEEEEDGHELEGKEDDNDDACFDVEKGASSDEPPAPLEGLTWRALIIGALLGTIFGIQNIYFGFLSGNSFGGSLVTSLLGYGIVRALIKAMPSSVGFTIQENVILQTAASTGQGIIFTGGFTTYILAMSPEVAAANQGLGTQTLQTVYWQQAVWLVTTVWLGFFLAIPMRRSLIVEKQYPWPSARATAVVLKALHADNGEAADKILKYLLQVAAVAFAWFFFCWLYGPSMAAWPILGAKAASYYWTADWNLAYVGSGVLMSGKAVWSLVLGAVIAFGFFLPLADQHDCFVPEGCGPSFRGTKSFWFLPVLALTVIDSLYQFVKIMCMSCMNTGVKNNEQVEGPVPSDEADIAVIASNKNDDSKNASTEPLKGSATYPAVTKPQPQTQFQPSPQTLTISPVTKAKSTQSRKSKSVGYVDPEPAERLVPDWVWMGGAAVNTLVMCIVLPIVFNIPWYLCVICVLLGPIMGYGINLGAALTDTALISAIGKLIIIVFGGVTGGDMVSTLWLSGIGMVAVGSSNDLLSDYVVAHETKTSPRAMFYAQLFAAGSCMFIMPLIYTLFLDAFPISATGEGEFTAPGAVALRALAYMFTGGLDTIPTPVWWFVLAYGIFGLVNSILNDILPTRYAKFFPSTIAMAIGGYVAPTFAINPLLGFVIAYLWKKTSYDQAMFYLPTLGAGLIAGTGCAAIFSAFFSLGGVTPPEGMAVSFAYEG